jgi:TetR/AcrR family transcriptional regulator, ethionamide resistance regulator
VPSFTVQATVGRARREATQRAILDAFRRLLEDGSSVAHLSVDKIVAEAGVSRSTFYVHFPDKRELVIRLAEEDLHDWREVAEPVLADPRADRAAVERIVREIIAGFRDHAVVARGLVELTGYDDEALGAWREVIGGVGVLVENHLRARWSLSGAAGDPELTGQAIAWMFERFCHQVLLTRDPAEDERAIAALTEATWRMIDR